MILSIEGPLGFRYLWLKYVEGFDPRQHCARCLRGRYERAIEPGLATPARVELRPESAPFVYLCGVAGRWADNLHLAMRPAPGARAEARGYDGSRIVVEGAEPLAIPELPAGWGGLGAGFTTCRNYRFGVAYFGGIAP
jgi:hypothetical protein